MTAIITEKFRLANAETFHSGFSGSDKYFLFIGKSTSWSSLDGSGVNDGAPPTPADDVSSEYYYWDDMIAAKNLASTDVSFVIPRRNWATATVYDMYEDDVSASNTATSGATTIFSMLYVADLPRPNSGISCIDQKILDLFDTRTTLIRSNN